MLITIIEDEKILSLHLSKQLIKNGFNTQIFNSYNDFINTDYNIADLFIIDLSLIDGSGFDIIKILRKKKIESPIIITSGYSDIEKKIYGLDMGADDYLSKPFSVEELIARIRVLLRRSHKNIINYNIKYNIFNYNSNNGIITKNGNEIELTVRETQFIEYMLFNIGKLITKAELINSVWGEVDLFKVSDNNINVIVSKVRKKLGKQFNLKTIKGKGYLLKK